MTNPPVPAAAADDAAGMDDDPQLSESETAEMIRFELRAAGRTQLSAKELRRRVYGRRGHMIPPTQGQLQVDAPTMEHCRTMGRLRVARHAPHAESGLQFARDLSG